MQLNPAKILSYDHIGIRVSDRDISKKFYQSLGFVETDFFQDEQANEMETASGVRINLIMNGSKQASNNNILIDEPIKYAGITHAAFVVDSIEILQAWLKSKNIAITEGPRQIGKRRISLFIRDPDGNVLEFNQLI